MFSSVKKSFFALLVFFTVLLFVACDSPVENPAPEDSKTEQTSDQEQNKNEESVDKEQDKNEQKDEQKEKDTKQEDDKDKDKEDNQQSQNENAGYNIVDACFKAAPSFYLNEKFDPSGKEINLVFQKGDDYRYETISYDSEKDNFVFPEDLIFTKAGDNLVNFTYKGLNGQLRVYVGSRTAENKNDNIETDVETEIDLSQYVIQSVVVTINTYKEYYKVNDSFDPFGLTLFVTWYNENAQKNVFVYKSITYEAGNNDFEFPQNLVFDKEEENKTIEFKYKGFPLSITVHIEDIPNTDIKCRYDEANATLYFYSDSYPVIFDYDALNKYLREDGEYPWDSYKSKTTKIILEEGIKKVSSLYDFPLLEEIEFPSTLVEIEGFTQCPALTSIEIPSTVNTIKSYAFSDNKNLKTVKFNKGLKKVEEAAFSKCSIKELNYPDSLEEIYCNFDKYTYPDLESLYIPDSVKVVNNMRIMQLNIKTIHFPENAEYHNEFFIGYCNEIEELKLPDSLKVLNGNTVASCEKLKKLSVGKSLEKIKHPNSPFLHLSALKYFYYDAINCYNYEDEDNWGVPLFNECGNQNEGIEIVIGKDVKRLLRDMVGSSDSDKQNYFKNISFEEGSQLEIIERRALNADFMDSTLELPDAVCRIDGDVKGNFKGTLKIPTKLKELPNFWGNNFTGDLYIPDTVTKITGFGLQNFDNVYISKNVTEIPDFCFTECTIKTINFSNIEAIRKGAFECAEFINTILELPDSVTVIEDAAFRGSNITKITLPKTLEILGSKEITSEIYYNRVFGGCAELTEVVLPENLEYIPDECFEDCYKLKTVNAFPKNLKKIGANAFKYTIVELKMNKFPDTLEYIGEYAFYVKNENNRPLHNYKNVTVPEFPGSLKYIGKSAFEMYFYDNKDSELVLPENMEYLSGFNECAVKSITIGKGTKEIGESAFCQTSTETMEKLIIPEGVETIGDRAFMGKMDGGSRGYMLGTIKSIELPASLKIIGSSAFAIWVNPGSGISLTQPDTYNNYCDGCYPIENLKSVTIKSATPPVLESITSFALQGIKAADKTKLDTTYNPNPKVKIYVPAGSKTNYTATSADAVWKIGTEVIELTE